jgi:hypothetical protein
MGCIDFAPQGSCHHAIQQGLVHASAFNQLDRSTLQIGCGLRLLNAAVAFCASQAERFRASCCRVLLLTLVLGVKRRCVE